MHTLIAVYVALRFIMYFFSFAADYVLSLSAARFSSAFL